MNPKVPKIQKTPAQLIAEIETRTPLAVNAVARQKGAIAAERAAEAALLARAVEFIKPALPSLCQSVPGLPGDKAVETAPGLWLRDDAQFGDLRSTGYGTAAFHPFDTFEEVIDGWELAEILSKLSTLLQRQIEGRGVAAVDAFGRAARLKAVAKLIEEEG